MNQTTHTVDTKGGSPRVDPRTAPVGPFPGTKSLCKLASALHLKVLFPSPVSLPSLLSPASDRDGGGFEMSQFEKNLIENIIFLHCKRFIFTISLWRDNSHIFFLSLFVILFENPPPSCFFLKTPKCLPSQNLPLQFSPRTISLFTVTVRQPSGSWRSGSRNAACPRPAGVRPLGFPGMEPTPMVSPRRHFDRGRIFSGNLNIAPHRQIFFALYVP